MIFFKVHLKYTSEAQLKHTESILEVYLLYTSRKYTLNILKVYLKYT